MLIEYTQFNYRQNDARREKEYLQEREFDRFPEIWHTTSEVTEQTSTSRKTTKNSLALQQTSAENNQNTDVPTCLENHMMHMSLDQLDKDLNVALALMERDFPVDIQLYDFSQTLASIGIIGNKYLEGGTLELDEAVHHSYSKIRIKKDTVDELFNYYCSQNQQLSSLWNLYIVEKSCSARGKIFVEFDEWEPVGRSLLPHDKSLTEP
ncbi:unnamed protein product [Mytilus coruscus]|uniref:Uncharacterized protein n=1 Tax=Mytilus coruscus TaxID=42192 RepID=A0A6J8EZI0_MYTCO|nr:unnamed protein product [Mytilus coruscus]